MKPTSFRIAILAAAICRAQPQSFEVSTIKPSQSLEVSLRVEPGAVFTSRGTSLIDLIQFAYDLHSREVIGGPAWLKEEKFDVTAKTERSGMPDAQQLGLKLEPVKAAVDVLVIDRAEKPSPN